MSPTLEQLKGLHLDGFIWWPLAPGWYAVIILLAVLVYLLIKFLKPKSVKITSDNAINTLESIVLTYKKDKNKSKYLQSTNALLKQVSIEQHGRDTAAHLNGEDWASFLNKSTSNDLFSQAQIQALSLGLYQKQPDIDVISLNKAVNKWIKAQYKNQKKRSAQGE